MTIECNYSFADLYIAAFGRKPRVPFQKKFLQLTQNKRNDLVKKWVKRAGWQTQEKIGTDGTLYVAFAPRF